jgi:hypothetical protein
MTEPTSRALVVLPFATPEIAEQFARIITVQMDNVAAPFVLHGTAYEYRSEESGEMGQIIEVYPDSNFDVFQGADGERHHVLQRITQEASDAERTGGSVDHDGPEQGAGEGG